MLNRRLRLLALLLAGCGGPDATPPPDTSGPVDAPIDAPVEAPIDAAAIDAPPPDGQAGGCLGEGTACTADEECCNHLCDRPDPGAPGTCAVIGRCKSLGEPCDTEGLTGECCSTVCLDARGEGVTRCQPLGGCLQDSELCSSGAGCCIGVCAQDGFTMDGRPVNRCSTDGGCLAVGEVCGDGGLGSNCCPFGGSATGCEPTMLGLSRCVGGVAGCGSLPGQACAATDDCCTDTYAGITCQPTARGPICCLADGDACAFGDLCCGGICAPATDGALRCRSECVPDGGACTADADCCGCCEDGTCTSGPACGTCAGAQLGESCDPAGAACCSEPPVECIGIGHPTCGLVVAP